MFGDDWRGVEAFARRADDPKATQAERAEIMAHITTLSVEAVQYETVLGLDVPPEEHQAASNALAPIQTEKHALKKKLTAIPLVTDYWVKDYDAHTRRQTVENELRAAFEKGDLDLILGNSSVANMRGWSDCADCLITNQRTKVH